MPSTNRKSRKRSTKPSTKAAGNTKRRLTKLPVLVSYAYLRDQAEERVDEVLGDKRIEYLLDSGAFTAFNSGTPIHLKEYMTFLNRWGSRFVGYAALDVVQNPVATERNLHTMLDKGFKPLPVHVFGDDEARLNELFDLSDWVMLAGLRRPHRGHAPKSYVGAKHKWANGRRVHWLGYTKAGMLARYRPYSCDCANWKATRMWGEAFIYLGRGRWFSAATFKYRNLHENKAFMDPLFTRALDQLGMPMELVMKEIEWHGGAGAVHEILSTRSWVWYVHDFLEQYGTRIFLASAPEDVKVLSDGLTWYRETIAK